MYSRAAGIKSAKKPNVPVTLSTPTATCFKAAPFNKLDVHGDAGETQN